MKKGRRKKPFRATYAKITLSALPHQKKPCSLPLRVGQTLRHNWKTPLNHAYTDPNPRIAQVPCLESIEKGRFGERRWHPGRQVIISIAAQPSPTGQLPCVLPRISPPRLFYCPRARLRPHGPGVTALGSPLLGNPSTCWICRTSSDVLADFKEARPPGLREPFYGAE